MKTKRLPIILGLMLVFIMGTYAQSISIRGGLNLAKTAIMQNDESLEGIETRVGFQGGILGEFGSDMIALETGLLFSQKGYTFDESIPFFQDASGNITMNYLEVPINARISFGGESAKVFVAAGPYIGYAIGGTIMVESPLGSNEEDIEFGSDPDEDDFKAFDYGVNIGAGVEVMRFKLGATYGLGLANLEIEPEDGESFKHRVIQIHLGYRIVE